MSWRSHKYTYHIAKQTMKGEENFMKQIYSVFDETINLNAGSHCFGFMFNLPMNIPPSFSDKNGKICYSVEALLLAESSSENISSAKSYFEMFCGKKFEFITLPTFEVEKTFKKRFKKTEPLHVTLNMPIKSFFSEDYIPINVHIDNKSGIEVKAIVINLLKFTKYKSLNPKVDEKIKTEKILTYTFVRKMFQKKDNLEAFVKLPVIEPICDSGIITVFYELNVSLKMSNFNTFPKIRIPLDIKT